MKKLSYSALALAAIFTVSCNKEIQPAEPAAAVEGAKHLETIRASFGDGLTRTDYAGQTFTWIERDSIYVQVESEPDETGAFSFGFAKFYAQSSGPSVDFVGEVTDGYHASSPAFYIAINADFDLGTGEDGLFDGNYFIFMPSYTTVGADASQGYFAADPSKPLGNMPLVGLQQSDGSYSFTSMTGALKLEFTDLDPSAAIIEIYNDDNKLSGEFSLDEDLTLKMDNARPGTYTYNDSERNYSNYYNLAQFQQNSDHSATIYMPMPVGTIPAGAKIVIMNEDMSETYFEKTFRKDVSIARNTVTELASLKAAHEWVSFGTGKFIDTYTWSLLFSDQGTTFIDVDIEQDSADPSAFRIVTPYQNAAKQFKYKNASTTYIKNSLTLNVGPDGHVTYPDIYYTGLKRTYTFSNKNYTSEHTLLYPTDGDPTYDDSGCTVVQYASDGSTPASIQLTACYYWPTPGVWTLDNLIEDNVIRILFGDANDFEISTVIYGSALLDPDPAHATASAIIAFSEQFEKAQVVLAQSEEEALAALADPSKYTEVTEDGATVTLDFPANAPSGSYYIYAHIIPAAGYAQSLERFIVGDEIAFDNPNEDRQIELEDVLGYYTTGDDIVAYYDFDKGGYYLYEDGPLVLKVEESDNPIMGEVMISRFFYDDDVEYPAYGNFDSASGHIEFQEEQMAYENLQIYSDTEEKFDIYFINEDPWDLRYGDDASLAIIQPSFPYIVYAYPTGTFSTEQGARYYVDVFAGVNPKSYALRNLTFYKTDEPTAIAALAKGRSTGAGRSRTQVSLEELTSAYCVETGASWRPFTYSTYTPKPIWNRR